MFGSNTFKVPNVKLTLNSQCKQIDFSKISNHCSSLISIRCIHAKVAKIILLDHVHVCLHSAIEAVQNKK